ncbi:2-oxoglutarate-dependent dioxygenase [Quillaja saponaria]|uniref:2-oxoglutarate-dependent dioxygenase n=1 Tax=Quillaja saponaria TaxID=32244 RepID=A0AAD7PQ08_QUISA|nr:2-oxoglutarate-dependent dioxygenase [Quillaja saponaria]
MEAETTPRLPVIDLSNVDYLKPNTSEWDLVKSKVHKALEEYGCFEALFDKIPLDLRKAVFAALEQLFDLPLQTKQRNVSKKPFHGYIGQSSMQPLYESLGIEDSNFCEKVESLTSILWPEGNPSFRRMVLESLGVENYLDEHMKSSSYLFRVTKYKGPQTKETKLGLKSHKDKNLVTILYQNDVEGLEVQTKHGEWFVVKPSPESFIVMIGGSLVAWTNGRLYSPCHRVMMTGNEARYSTALFSVPKGGYITKAPEELVDEEHPLLYKPFDYAEFLKYFATEEGQKNEDAFKTYCGV